MPMMNTSAPAAPVRWVAAVRYLRRGPALNIWTADATTEDEAREIITGNTAACGVGPVRIEHIEVQP